MIPFGLTEGQFAERYRGILDRQTKSAVLTIKEVLAKTVPDDVLAAQLEVFLDDSGYGAPAVWMYFSGKNTRISKTDESIFPGRALKFELDLGALADFDEEYFTSEFNGLGTAADVMRQWVAECWWKAGGWSYPLPVVLAIHDGWGSGELVSLTESDA
jgi:Family of unknown function (DUF6389)